MTEVSESVLTPLRFLERSAQVWAQRPAVVSGERTFTYAEHHERIRRLAGALRELGVGPGDRVATLLPNVHAMLELHYAVPGIGAVLVPLNTRLTADDYAYILEHSGARLTVVAPELRDKLGLSTEVVDADEYERLLADGEPGVQRHQHRADPRHRVVQLQHRRDVGQQRRHAVAGLDPELPQRPGQAPDPLVVLGVGERPLAGHHGWPLRPHLRAALEEAQWREDGLRHRGHVLAIPGRGAGRTTARRMTAADWPACPRPRPAPH